MSAEKSRQDDYAYWKVGDFARHLNLSPRTLWAAIAAGQLAVVRFGRRATRIERAEALRFIEAARSRAST